MTRRSTWVRKEEKNMIYALVYGDLSNLIGSLSRTITGNISIYQISEQQFSRGLIGFRNSECPWLFTVLRPDEAVVQANTQKATNFGLTVFTER